MTLRTIESEFSQELLKQMQERSPIDLTMDGPIITRLHPKIIWNKLLYQHNPEQELPAQEIPGWQACYYATSKEAQEAHPEIELNFDGRPWNIYQFLEGKFNEAIIHFPPLGSVVLSKNDLPSQTGNGLHQHVLPGWVTYALSPELWGPVGKWTRFHSRLHQILKDYKLLDGEDSVGYYPLISEAESLEEFGFLGTKLEKSFVLVLPWDFSLSELKKLEETIRQEFKCSF